jgi:hypothetical protein
VGDCSGELSGDTEGDSEVLILVVRVRKIGISAVVLCCVVVDEIVAYVVGSS